MLLNIFSSGRIFGSLGCVKITLPAKSGQMEIKPGHCPYSCLLSSGKLTAYQSGSKSIAYYINRGMLAVKDDEVNIFAEFASSAVASQNHNSNSIKSMEKFLQKNPALDHLPDRLRQRQAHNEFISKQ